MSEKKIGSWSEPGNSKAFEGKGSESLMPENIAAIEFSRKIGKEIKQKFPQIAVDFVNGKTLRKLSLEYNIQNSFGIKNQKTAEMSVLNALKGTQEYPGLITNQDVWKAIVKGHREISASKVGSQSRDLKSGMFGINPEDRIEIARASGKALMKSGRGIHAQTSAQNVHYGKMSVESKGLIPVSGVEENLVEQLAQQLPRERGGSRLDLKKMAEIVNDRIHSGKPVRNGETIGGILYRKKKRYTKATNVNFHEGSD